MAGLAILTSDKVRQAGVRENRQKDCSGELFNRESRGLGLYPRPTVEESRRIRIVTRDSVTSKFIIEVTPPATSVIAPLSLPHRTSRRVCGLVFMFVEKEASVPNLVGYVRKNIEIWVKASVN